MTKKGRTEHTCIRLEPKRPGDPHLPALMHELHDLVLLSE
jgi:hypothetical protein